MGRRGCVRTAGGAAALLRPPLAAAAAGGRLARHAGSLRRGLGRCAGRRLGTWAGPRAPGGVRGACAQGQRRGGGAALLGAVARLAASRGGGGRASKRGGGWQPREGGWPHGGPGRAGPGVGPPREPAARGGAPAAGPLAPAATFAKGRPSARLWRRSLPPGPRSGPSRPTWRADAGPGPRRRRYAGSAALLPGAWVVALRGVPRPLSRAASHPCGTAGQPCPPLDCLSALGEARRCLWRWAPTQTAPLRLAATTEPRPGMQRLRLGAVGRALPLPGPGVCT